MIACEAFAEGLDPKKCTAEEEDDEEDEDDEDDEDEKKEDKEEDDGGDDEEGDEDEEDGYRTGYYGRRRLYEFAYEGYTNPYGASRTARASSLLLSGAVTPLDSIGVVFEVMSQSGVGSYKVVLTGGCGVGTCECPDFQKGYRCKHIIAAKKYKDSSSQMTAERKAALLAMIPPPSPARSTTMATSQPQTPVKAAVAATTPRRAFSEPSMGAELSGCLTFMWQKSAQPALDR
jgi:hypothetical protein